MLDNNDYLRIGIDGIDYDKIETGFELLLMKAREQFNNGCLTLMPIKRPYMVNVRHVEYVEGVWNDEKTEYGIKIGYISGSTRCFWGGTARSVLETLAMDGSTLSSEICAKFDERVKAGPPRL